MLCKKHNIEKVWRKNGSRRRRICRLCHNEQERRHLAADPRRALVRHARSRAKEFGIPFSIEMDDIVIPTHCPVLGIKLESGMGKPQHASPTIDRLKPELGYVQGNITVISNRANMIKSVGSAEEHEKIAAWMRRVNVRID